MHRRADTVKRQCPRQVVVDITDGTGDAVRVFRGRRKSRTGEDIKKLRRQGKLTEAAAFILRGQAEGKRLKQLRNCAEILLVGEKAMLSEQSSELFSRSGKGDDGIKIPLGQVQDVSDIAAAVRDRAVELHPRNQKQRAAPERIQTVADDHGAGPGEDLQDLAAFVMRVPDAGQRVQTGFHIPKLCDRIHKENTPFPLVSVHSIPRFSGDCKRKEQYIKIFSNISIGNSETVCYNQKRN